MIEHSSHVGFIVAAYVVAGVVIGTMIASTFIDYRGLRRALARFGARGLDTRE
jgi:heme exporter protein CcmD